MANINRVRIGLLFQLLGSDLVLARRFYCSFGRKLAGLLDAISSIKSNDPSINNSVDDTPDSSNRIVTPLSLPFLYSPFPLLPSPSFPPLPSFLSPLPPISLPIPSPSYLSPSFLPIPSPYPLPLPHCFLYFPYPIPSPSPFPFQMYFIKN